MDEAVSARSPVAAGALARAKAFACAGLPGRAGVLTCMLACAWACACALALAGAPARAQTLDDPTRPPAALQALASDTGEAPAPSRPQLQSVLLARGQGGRRVAVIDGQTVRVGDKVHGYVLASVGDAEAVLVRGKEREVLKLYPSSVAPAAAPSQR